MTFLTMQKKPPKEATSPKLLCVMNDIPDEMGFNSVQPIQLPNYLV